MIPSTKRFSYSTASDDPFLQQAVECAQNGKTHTFPNPAVGCVLVSRPSDHQEVVIGQGFHPKAGFPHAEVFALLEAAQHVESGLKAASSVIDGPVNPEVLRLTQVYSTEGADVLFKDCCTKKNVTAYVTLEPCCHYGRTPPCAAALVSAGVSRVVVGVRDPNPRVDGGGVQVLETGGVSTGIAEGKIQEDCKELIRNFGKRITMPPLPEFTGKDRRSLRSIANRMQAEKNLTCVEWAGDKVEEAADVDGQTAVDDLVIPAHWLELVDDSLWENELVLLRLNNAVDKRKQSEAIGRRVADLLQAHLAESKGHTILLYRASLPPRLDWRVEETVEAG